MQALLGSRIVSISGSAVFWDLACATDCLCYIKLLGLHEDMNEQRSISSVGLERGANNAKVLGSTPILTNQSPFALLGPYKVRYLLLKAYNQRRSFVVHVYEE